MRSELRNKLEELQEKIYKYAEGDSKFPAMSYEQGLRDVLEAIDSFESEDSLEEINELLEEY